MIRNVFPVPNPFFQTSNPSFLLRNPFLSGKTGNPLPPCNGPVTCWSSLMLRWQEPEISCHICHVFPPWSGPFSPSRFHTRCNIPCPRHQTVPRVVASVARESQALATVTPVISNGLGGAVARLQEISRIACIVHIKPLF